MRVRIGVVMMVVVPVMMIGSVVMIMLVPGRMLVPVIMRVGIDQPAGAGAEIVAERAVGHR